MLQLSSPLQLLMCYGVSAADASDMVIRIIKRALLSVQHAICCEGRCTLQLSEGDLIT